MIPRHKPTFHLHTSCTAVLPRAVSYDTADTHFRNLFLGTRLLVGLLRTRFRTITWWRREWWWDHCVPRGTRGVDTLRTRPVIANNIIRRCYHGVGFKDGAHPPVVNNLDCFVGITLDSERNDNPGAATTAGNIIWHDGHFGPAARSVVLGSTWWQAICKRRALQWGGQRGELQGSMCCSRRDFPAAGAMCGSQRRTQIRRARPTTGVAVGGLRHFAVTTSLL